MKKLLMAILAILTFATGSIEARRGGRGGRRHGGRRRHWHGGRGERGFRRGGRGRGRGHRYFGPPFYVGTPWYSPYSYERDVVYLQQPESELSKLQNRVNGLIEAQQAQIAQGNSQMVASLQREIDGLRARINQLTGVSSGQTMALQQQQAALAQQQKMIAQQQQTIAQQQQELAQQQAPAKKEGVKI